MHETIYTIDLETLAAVIGGGYSITASSDANGRLLDIPQGPFPNLDGSPPLMPYAGNTPPAMPNANGIFPQPLPPAIMPYANNQPPTMPTID